MKRFFLGFLFILALSSAQFASAHIYRTDGAITVLLHTNPDDDPIVGQPAMLLFQVSDTTNHFNASKCVCKITISNQDQQLFSGQLQGLGTAPSIYDLTIPFTFPVQAVYGIDVAGQPQTAGNFQSFQLHYDLRVSRIVIQPDKFTNPMIWIASGILMAGVIILILYVYKK